MDKPTARDSARLFWGKLLERLGFLGLPLGFGAVLGFYAADRGMRLIPTMVEIFLVASFFSLAAVVLGRFIAGSAYEITTKMVRLRRRIIVCLALILVALSARLVLFWTQQPSPLTGLSAETFDLAFQIDSQRYRELDHGLENAVAYLEKQPNLFKPEHVLDADQEQMLLETWVAIVNQAFALDHIRLFYEDWYRFDVSRVERSYHLRSFLLTFAAELSLYEKCSRLLRLIGENKNAVKFLDAPHLQQQLPAESFSRLRQELQGERDQARVLAGREYLRAIGVGFGAHQEAHSLGLGWLWRDINRHIDSIAALSHIELAVDGISSDLEPLKRVVRHTWFPAQSKVAEWMGDTRTRRIGQYLITTQQLQEMERHLQPGDILMARKNWYLSNVGLPGFWPHAELYIGDPKKLMEFFDDPEVVAFWQQQVPGFTSLHDHLSRLQPYHWWLYQGASQQHPLVVLEAISEGVSLSTLAHASGDYLVALRPKLDKVAISQAVVAAFGHLGKPYDFDFDFATDHALVCTEVIWRAYRPATNKEGLTFPLVNVMGRQTLPANELAKIVALRHGTAQQQLEFVYFLDASESRQQAFVADERAFLQSYKRIKWDPFLQ